MAQQAVVFKAHLAVQKEKQVCFGDAPHPRAFLPPVYLDPPDPDASSSSKRKLRNTNPGHA
eukprot:5294398-Prorocentrum_lima.AAC.1